MKTVDFSETIAASDLKVGRCRQLIEFMKVCEYFQGHFVIIYVPGFVCFVLYLAKISGERLKDHWSSGSETIVACDLKVGRCRQLIEFMKVSKY